ncbi:MAG: toll/interleukin-1 receptor domain-containing protein, partial [Planctomycetaceae bacterium]
MGDKFDIFFSYNSDDSVEVHQLAELLAKPGFKVWTFERQGMFGERFLVKLGNIMKEVDSAAILIGKHGLTEWVELECEECLRQYHKRQMRIIPVVLPGAAFPPKLPLFIDGFPWIDLRKGITEEGIGSLLQALGNPRSRVSTNTKRTKRPGAKKLDVPLESEWMVQAARRNPAFLTAIHQLHDAIQNNPKVDPGSEVVITLYAKSFPEEGVGSFEYDLIYYRNVMDDSPMFGPTVKDDDRTKFIENEQKRYDIGLVGEGKPGGFIAREGIKSFAKFKLLNDHWNTNDPWSTGTPSSRAIEGLLFINGRHRPLPDSVFKTPEIATLLARITELTSEIS